MSWIPDIAKVMAESKAAVAAAKAGEPWMSPPVAPSPLTAQQINDLNAQTMRDHALCTTYRGPYPSGITFDGWPLPELVQAALPHSSTAQRLAAIATFMKAMPPGSLAGVVQRAGATTAPMQQYSDEQLLAGRMRWGVPGNPWAPGFSDITIKRAGGSVHVWVITKDAKSVVLEDEPGLYPSDALITKLNMLKQE